MKKIVAALIALSIAAVCGTDGGGGQDQEEAGRSPTRRRPIPRPATTATRSSSPRSDPSARRAGGSRWTARAAAARASSNEGRGCHSREREARRREPSTNLVPCSSPLDSRCCAALGGNDGDGRSVQHRPLEEAATVGRRDADLEGLALAVDQQRHVDAGLAQRPDAPEQARQIAHLRAGDAQDDVAGAQVRLLRRTAAGEPQDGDVAADLGGIEPEPGTRRAVGPADGEQVVAGSASAGRSARSC